MKEHASDAIRNVVFAGHGGTGKTSLQEACLLLAGVTDRAGRVEDGNTASDYLPEEIKRKGSIYTSVLSFETGNVKFNFLDTPGYADFAGELCGAVTAAENAVLVANATAGLDIGLETAARRARDNGLACFLFINHLDRERASYDRVFDELHHHHLPVVALTYPLGLESSLRGFVDVIENKAYEDKGGKLNEVDVPAASAERIARLRNDLIEAVVECDDDLMSKYLDGEELAPGEIKSLLGRCVASGGAIPVLCGSATRNIGVGKLLETLQALAISPVAARPRMAVDAQGTQQPVAADDDAPFSGFVWKTFSDPFTGRLTFIKIVSGTLRRDADVVNLDRPHHEKCAHLLVPLGKKQSEIGVLHAGDIVLLTKLKGTGTGDTLSSNPNAARFPRPEVPQGFYTQAVEPMTHGDDDKLSDALARLAEEDQTLRVARSGETGQLTISGLGDIHLAMVKARLKSSFGVDVAMSDPRVPYRETIRKAVKFEGKLKKQSGGHGQFADVWLELEPNVPGGGFEFHDRIVGGVVPRAFIPAVQEGVTEATKEGPLAGYPLLDVKVTLYDGKYHDVNSSYQTFKVAAGMGLRGGAREAAPVLLEPIMETLIDVPGEAAGDVVGDLNSRRGHILSMEPDGATVRVKAHVPEAELLQYPIVLRSLTHGRGTFCKQFDHYNPVPDPVARPIIEAYQARREHHA